MAGKKIVVFGDKALDAALREMGPTLAKKVTRKGLRKAATFLQKEIKANTPKESGKLRKAIKVRAGKRSRVIISTVVGVIDPAEAHIAVHQEYGTEDIKANPFMRKTADTKGGATIDLAIEELRQSIEEAAKELGFELGG